LTRQQIIHLHGGDTSVADSIIKKKEAEGAFAPHPDLENVKTYYATWPHKVLN